MGRREDNKRRKREALEATALRLLQDHGYDRTSIEQIAQGAGVARGTFYLYFDDKLALFDALMDRWYAPMLGVLEDVGRELARATDPAQVVEVYRGMAVGLAVVGLAHSDEIVVAFRQSRQPGDAGQSLRRRELEIIDAVVAFTEEAAGRGLISPPDARLICLVVFGAVERLFYEALVGTQFDDPQGVAQEVLRLFTGALGLPDFEGPLFP